ncbi:MAG: pectinacetylesterase family protein [Hyphomonadaceae bacterium]|nr:pectinacetylesterase family protein [Hyphomonadaceae bacterium]
MLRTVWLAAALALTGCSASQAAHVAATEAAEAPATMSAPGGWMQITPAPGTIDGDRVTATCSNAPGGDPAYRFWIRRGSADGLVIFFDGGGACWDDLTCSVPWLATGRADDGFYKAELLPGDDPNRFGGMFALNDARNPVRDWSFVFVPYCTGDVHVGQNTPTYRNVDSGDAFDIRHRGSDNVRIVLDWVERNMSAPQRLLVAGSSAGAYGAGGHYIRIREAFPRADAIMFGDAGQGVATAEFSAATARSWGYRPPRALREGDTVSRLAALFPNDRFAQFTTAHDRTQSAFYALMGVDNACRAWGAKMREELSERQRAANFRSYVAAGQAHTILRSPAFYTETSGGGLFLDWFKALLDGDAPQNRVCANCDAPPAQCGF